MELKFSKYQGCGNDFIIVDTPYSEEISREQRSEVAKFLCDRHFGIGGDDVLYLEPSPGADAAMKIFEAQGPEADMCGNGVRCAGAYLCSKLDKTQVDIETNDGIKRISSENGRYRVGLGKFRTKMKDVIHYFNSSFPDDESLVEMSIEFPNLGQLTVSVVNSGEPHCVIFVDDVEGEDMDKYGKNISENIEMFPRGINVDLVECVSENNLKVRTYERGVFGETLACGTGAAASVGVARDTGRISSNVVEVLFTGGRVQIEVSGSDLFLVGPATKVFDGLMLLDV